MKRNQLLSLLPTLLRKVSHSRQHSESVSNSSVTLSTKLLEIAQQDIETVLRSLKTTPEGLSTPQSQIRLDRYGFNEIAREKTAPWYIQSMNG
jgi:Mg2+-importing ATPase